MFDSYLQHGTKLDHIFGSASIVTCSSYNIKYLTHFYTIQHIAVSSWFMVANSIEF